MQAFEFSAGWWIIVQFPEKDIAYSRKIEERFINAVIRYRLTMFASTIIVLLIITSGGFSAAYPADRVNMEQYCGRTVTLPCPYSQGSAGTIRFLYMPSVSCNVKVTTSSSCGSYGDTFSIYFNIRKSFMPQNSKMEIYDTSVTRTLEKQWSGGMFQQTQYSNPTSAGQFLSSYARKPEISVEFTPSSFYSPTSAHEVYFDYVIIERQYSSYSTYCSALSGYVNDKYICDTADDRVNCPSSYSDQTYSMGAAMSRQYCDTGLDVAAIVGIVIGCVGFIAIVGGIVACVACSKRRPRVTEAQTVAFTNNNYTAAPSVMVTTPGAPPPYPTQMYASPYPSPGNVAMYAPPPANNAPHKQ